MLHSKVHKFLEGKQRGALIANARYSDNRNQPYFDWLTFEDVEETYDKTLQESIAFYKPAQQVLVFVFLLSPTGNSLAMWRRKIPIPDDVYQKYAPELDRIVKILSKRKFRVTVDHEVLSYFC